MRAPSELSVRAVTGIPPLGPGDDLAGIVLAACAASGPALASGDVVVIAQKIVSKSEGRMVELATVTPSPRAEALAAEVDKDPRVVELILRESVEVVRARNGVLITENRYGLVMANAGLDMSNVRPGEEVALLLPEDADASAARLRAALEAGSGLRLGVIVSDSIGRAWRECTVGHAIGVSGLPARVDLRGQRDLFGRELMVSEVALADSLAAAAAVVMGEAAEGRPVAIVRGLAAERPDGRARDVVRTRERDLFR